jgi:hypothetical protein
MIVRSDCRTKETMRNRTDKCDQRIPPTTITTDEAGGLQMTTENRTDTKPEKVERKRPNWKYHLKNRHAFLKDAVALSMNVSPGQVDALANSSTTFRNIFQTRLKAARLEMVPRADFEIANGT